MSDELNFLVLGAGRGGTSLLANCIAGHQDVEVGYEKFTPELLRGAAIDQRINRYNLLFRLHAFVKQCNFYASKRKEKLVGNKILVENIYWLQDCLPTEKQDPEIHIKQFFNFLPKKLKIVFIVRDGRNIIASKVNRTGQPYSLAVFRYQYFITVLRYLKENWPSLLVVKFENLVSDPKSTMSQVADFLEVDFDDDMIQTNGAKMPTVYQQSTFDQSKLVIQSIPDMYLPLITDGLFYTGYQSSENQ